MPARPTKRARLPSGRELDLTRPRSAGPLDSEEFAYCIEHDLPLAYDPMQIGWVLKSSADDLTSEAPFGSASPHGPGLPASAADSFERKANEIVAEHRDGAISALDTGTRVWEVAERVLRDLGAPDTNRGAALDVLRSLHQRARALLSEEGIRAADPETMAAACAAHAEKYVLRPWTFDDAERFVELLDNAEIWQHLPEDYPDPLTREIAEDLIALSNEADYHEVRAVELSGRVVGQVRLSFEHGIGEAEHPDDGEVSYWLGEKYWGQRIMSEVVPLYTMRCFENHRISSIFARVRESNVASSTLLERAGYRYEGPLVAELQNEPDMRTYRCFRSDYVAKSG